jgi:hypothetical protein
VQCTTQHDTTLLFLQIQFNIIPISNIILTENSIGKTKNETEGPVVAVKEAQKREETWY